MLVCGESHKFLRFSGNGDKIDEHDYFLIELWRNGHILFQITSKARQQTYFKPVRPLVAISVLKSSKTCCKCAWHPETTVQVRVKCTMQVCGGQNALGVPRGAPWAWGCWQAAASNGEQRRAMASNSEQWRAPPWRAMASNGEQRRAPTPDPAGNPCWALQIPKYAHRPP